MELAGDHINSFSGWARAEVLGLIIPSTVTLFVLYYILLHPLKHIPGPLIARVSPLFLYSISYLGIEGRVIRHYHRLYNTKVLRVAPNSVSVSDSEAIQAIYIAGGGYAKDARYANFNMGETVTIFSAIETEYRNARAKAVAPLFSPSRLRAACEPQGVIHQCVSEFVSQLEAFKKEYKSHSATIDILDLCARLSLDVVTGYLLNERYGGLNEHRNCSLDVRRTAKLSINPFIFAIVGFSRFSLLPNWLFGVLYGLSSRLRFSEAVGRCIVDMNAFASRVVRKACDDNGNKSTGKDLQDSYQSRLLAAEIPREEVEVQCQAIVFAGADSTAVKLATIMFHLIQNPDCLRRIREELRQANARQSSDAQDGQQMPYLRAVIKEGLRLGMANPTRMTRVVPSKGLQVGDMHIPAGTVVGCAASVLHHDPAVFPDPFAFRPERWLDEQIGGDTALRKPHMERSLLMFGAGSRSCIGKNLAQQQIWESVKAVVKSNVLEGARTCQDKIELVEWFNAEIKDHRLDIQWHDM